jgi:hypothetical protein
MSTPWNASRPASKFRFTRPLDRPRSRRTVALSRFHPVCPERIAPDLRRKLSCDGEGLREADVGILVRPVLRVVLQVVGPVGLRVAPDGVRAEPVADDVVDLAIREERTVRGLVHEDGEAELPGADHEEGHEDRERVRPSATSANEANDDRPS